MTSQSDRDCVFTSNSGTVIYFITFYLLITALLTFIIGQQNSKGIGQGILFAAVTSTLLGLSSFLLFSRKVTLTETGLVAQRLGSKIHVAWSEPLVIQYKPGGVSRGGTIPDTLVLETGESRQRIHLFSSMKQFPSFEELFAAHVREAQNVDYFGIKNQALSSSWLVLPSGPILWESAFYLGITLTAFMLNIWSMLQ